MSSSDVTISTANTVNTFVAGLIFVGQFFNGNGASGYTPTIYLRRSGVSFQHLSYIESCFSHTETHFTFGIQDFNGSGAYLDTSHNHNAGTTMTSTGSGDIHV